MTRMISHYADSIVETIREPLLVLDDETRVQLANAAFYRTFAVTAEQTLGKQLFELGNGQWNIPALLERLSQIRTDNRAFEDFEVIHSFETIGRRIMWLNGRRLVLPSLEGVILLAIEDVTQRRLAERALAVHTREMERSNGDLEQFAYVASHDLQEPLRKIRAYSDLLVAEYAGSLDSVGRDYVNRITGAAARMQVLIGELLTLSRVATAERSFAPVPLQGVVQEVLADMEVALCDAGGTVELGQMPTVEADRFQMRQLFQNLLSNALKFRRDGIPPRVTIDTGDLDGGLAQRIIISDNGIGFDAEHRDLIFAPFQRLHSRAAYPGTGMGLTICRKIVERHSGTIIASSTPGSGSSFTITLPTWQQHRSVA